MANGYQHRIEALEKRWNLRPTPLIHLVRVEPGETNEEAATRYAAAHGMAVADVLTHELVIFLRFVYPKQRN